MKMRRLQAVMAAVLFMSIGLPGLSSATPMEFSVRGDSALTVVMGALRGVPGGLGDGFKLRLRGRAIFDTETGILSEIITRIGLRRVTLPIQVQEDQIEYASDGSIRFGFSLPGRSENFVWLNLRPRSYVVAAAVGDEPSVPEPSAALLFGAGFLAVGAAGRRRGVR